MTTPENVTVQFQIADMTCGGCASKIEKTLRDRLPQVEPVLEVATKRLLAKFDPAQVSPDTIVSVVREAGYTAQPV